MQSAGLRRLAKVAAVTMGIAVGLTTAAAAEPAPSAREVRESQQQVRNRTTAVGQIKARLAAADARLEQLSSRAEFLVEAYNGELVKQARAKASHQMAVARLLAAEQRFEATRAQVARFVAESYQTTGGIDPVAAMVGGRPGHLNHVAMVEYLGGLRAQAQIEMEAARAVAKILRAQADAALADQRKATRRAAETKSAAHAAVDRQAHAITRIQQQKAGLEAQLAAARSTTERLERTRAEAVEAARIRAQRRTAGGEKWISWGKGAGSRRGDIAANWALTQLGKPYVWAADGPGSYDCSGLTMRAWQRVGIQLDHWTGTQWTSGQHIPISQLRRGDLVFFGNATRHPSTIHHVGIFIGRGMMVHAPRTGDVVKIAPIWRRDLVGATRPS